MDKVLRRNMATDLHGNVVLEKQVSNSVPLVKEGAIGIIFAMTSRPDVKGEGETPPWRVTLDAARGVVDNEPTRTQAEAGGRRLVRDRYAFPRASRARRWSRSRDRALNQKQARQTEQHMRS